MRKHLKGIKKSGNTRSETPFVEKALALLKMKLGIDCCTIPGVTYSYTRLDNDFTHTVKYLIKKLHGPGTDKILEKVIKILGEFLGSCCLIDVTVTWTNPADPDEITLSFIGQEGQGTIQTAGADMIQSLKIPSGNYIITLEYSGAINQFSSIVLSNGTPIATMTGTGTVPKSVSTLPMPISSTYTITATP